MNWKDILKKPLSERELAEVREFAQPKDMKTPMQKYKEYREHLNKKQKDLTHNHRWTVDYVDYLFAGGDHNISFEQSIHLLEEIVNKFGLELEPILERNYHGERLKHPFWDWATNRVKQLEQSSDKGKLETLQEEAYESRKISDVAARKRRRADI